MGRKVKNHCHKPFNTKLMGYRVARSTFCQVAKSGPETVKKASKSKTRGQKNGQLFFPNLSAVTKPNEEMNLATY